MYISFCTKSCLNLCKLFSCCANSFILRRLVLHLYDENWHFEIYTFLDSWGHVLSEKKKKLKKSLIGNPHFSTSWWLIMNILNILRYKILCVQFLSDLKKNGVKILRRAIINTKIFVKLIKSDLTYFWVNFGVQNYQKKKQFRRKTNKWDRQSP